MSVQCYPAPNGKGKCIVYHFYGKDRSLIFIDMRSLPVILLLFILPAGCSTGVTNGDVHPLAKKYCGACHQVPAPSLADKKTWLYYILPKMGALAGFRHFETVNYFADDSKTQTMSLNEWHTLVHYYISASPDSLTAGKSGYTNIDTTLSLFDIDSSISPVTSPATTFAAVGAVREQLFFGDGITKNIYVVNGGQVTDSLAAGTGLSFFRQTNQGIWALSMGVMYPSDKKSGQLHWYDANASHHIIIDSLQRPVHASFGDLNNDSLEDVIISEFGNQSGKLSWYERKKDGGFMQHTLRALPGAVKTETGDFDRNGKTDILAMMAQGDEGMFLYLNKGNGTFSEQRILQFSPSHGSNYFETADFNNDGYFDILTTNGDNGDYPPILKPYHGVRIYLNDGANRFSETVFLPVNGACKAMVADFDKDGDTDIASISYFPDFIRRPGESFILWKNEGNLQFKPASFNPAISGRWLTMDAGDIDHDGDTDIVLGNAPFAMGTVPPAMLDRWKNNAPSVFILRNRLSIIQK